ncbi:MAG: citrate lyase acyl carrier protein [Synergistota bacterium]|nr:citrate lyase acyl carrier protein [Synergistota bacterium]
MCSGTARAGTLESSDCLVTVGPGSGVALEYAGGNAFLFRKRTEAIVKEILESRALDDISVSIQDQGALEPTLRARVETALDRAFRKKGDV